MFEVDWDLREEKRAEMQSKRSMTPFNWRTVVRYEVAKLSETSTFDLVLSHGVKNGKIVKSSAQVRQYDAETWCVKFTLNEAEIDYVNSQISLVLNLHKTDESKRFPNRKLILRSINVPAVKQHLDGQDQIDGQIMEKAVVIGTKTYNSLKQVIFTLDQARKFASAISDLHFLINFSQDIGTWSDSVMFDNCMLWAAMSLLEKEQSKWHAHLNRFICDKQHAWNILSDVIEQDEGFSEMAGRAASAFGVSKATVNERMNVATLVSAIPEHLSDGKIPVFAQKMLSIMNNNKFNELTRPLCYPLPSNINSFEINM